MGKPYRGYINIAALAMIFLVTIYFKLTSDHKKSLFLVVVIALATTSSLHLISPDFLSSNVVWYPIFLFVATYLHGKWGARLLTAIGAILYIVAVIYRNVVNIEVEHLTLNGAIRTDVMAIFLAALSVYYIVLALQKEEAQVKKDLTKSHDMLKELNESNSALLAVMSHDLATPVTVMNAYITKSRTDDVAYDRVMDALSNFQNILKEVKHLRSVGTGKLSIELKKTSLLQNVRASIMDVSDRANKKNVAIKLESYAREETFNILADPISLRTSVIVNILSNCIKFSYRDSSIEISINENDKNTILTIKDYGIGIPQKILAALFDFSTKTTRNGTDNEKGTGFGMPIVKMFVDRYGGEIEVKSRPVDEFPFEHGSEFIISFKRE
jgi:signal transduction histidine kinase